MSTTLVVQLMNRLADLTLQVRALQQVLEQHGIPGDEINKAVQKLQVEDRGDLRDSMQAAQKASEIVREPRTRAKYRLQ